MRQNQVVVTSTNILQRMSTTLVIFTGLTALISTFVSGSLTVKDICHEGLKPETLKTALHSHSTPRDKLQAGNFTLKENVTELSPCILRCCRTSTCDSVYFIDSTCYLLQCNTSVVGACDPVEITKPSYYVEVKKVRYEPHGDADHRTASVSGSCDPQTHAGCHVNEECRFDEDFHLSLCFCRKGFIRNKLTKACIKETSPVTHHVKSRVKTCEKGLPGQCGSHEECYSLPDHDNKIGVCVCMAGYSRDTADVCVKSDKDATNGASVLSKVTTTQATQEKDTTQTFHAKLKACEYGLKQCGEHQVCYIPQSSLSRMGKCLCVKGYTMDKDGKCLLPAAVNSQTSSGKTTAKTTPKVSPTKMMTTTTVPPVTELTVSAGKDKVVQLPENEVTLNAYVMEDNKNKESKFHYEWTLIASPDGAETGTMVGKNTDKLKLTKLIAGLYTFKIKVTGLNKEGSDFVNVTVLPVKRKNTPPVAVIKPQTQVVQLPKSAILDGSDSTDDDKIVKYHWEEMSGPIKDQQINDDSNMLTLKQLAPGIYKFKLTVTDSDGVTDSAIANVTVIKEMDYPPKANAGSDIVIELPQNTVKLCGNGSTDDKGIKSYEWIKSADDKLTADMAGVRSECLTLSKLQKGDYTFTLKVTDTSGQTSSAVVHVFVKPSVNKPPTAVTAYKQTIFLPQSYLLLDGHNSTDDKAITSYLWQQVSGPVTLKIDDATKSVAKATGELKVGEYHFTLTVKDAEDLHSAAQLYLTVKESINKPPVAKAGGDKSVTMPVSVVSLDGSHSTDDKGIISYHWTRDQKSLAAGDVLNRSDHQAVLQLVNLVSGRYIFSLTVTDHEGLKSTDSASLVIREDPHENDLLELVIDADIKQFTEEDKTNLQYQLSLMLPSTDNGDIHIKIQSIENVRSKGWMRFTFYAMIEQKDYVAVRTGVETLAVLKKKIKQSGSHLLNFHVLSLDTVVCQNNCSGHGVCDMKTKLCVCEAFWMQNFFTFYFMEGESNCDWSVLYVVIVLFLSVVTMAAIVWGVICYCKKRRCRCKWRTKKRHRYSLLQEVDCKDEMEMLPKEKIQNSSVMISESDFTSDEETLFVNHKKTNGFIQKPPNGINRQHLKTKLKT